MPSLGPTPIRPPRLKVGNVVGYDQIKQGWEMVKMSAWLKWMEEMDKYANLYTPYRSGQLLRSVLNIIESSTVEMYYIGADVPHASYVNEMEPPIKWTNPMSKYQFFQQMWDYAIRIIEPIYSQLVREAGLNKITGQTATQFMEAYA